MFPRLLLSVPSDVSVPADVLPPAVVSDFLFVSEDVPPNAMLFCMVGNIYLSCSLSIKIFYYAIVSW